MGLKFGEWLFERPYIVARGSSKMFRHCCLEALFTEPEICLNMSGFQAKKASGKGSAAFALKQADYNLASLLSLSPPPIVI